MNKKRLFVAVSDSQDRPSSSPCRPNLCKLVHVGLATNDDRTVSLSLCYNKSPAAVDLLLRSRLLNVESKSFQFIMETEGLERKKEGRGETEWPNVKYKINFTEENVFRSIAD